MGGMERLNWHLAAELSRYTTLHLIAPKGAAASVSAYNIQVTEVSLYP